MLTGLSFYFYFFIFIFLFLIFLLSIYIIYLSIYLSILSPSFRLGRRVSSPPPPPPPSFLLLFFFLRRDGVRAECVLAASGQFRIVVDPAHIPPASHNTARSWSAANHTPVSGFARARSGMDSTRTPGHGGGRGRGWLSVTGCPSSWRSGGGGAGWLAGGGGRERGSARSPRSRTGARRLGVRFDRTLSSWRRQSLSPLHSPCRTHARCGGRTAVPHIPP